MKFFTAAAAVMAFAAQAFAQTGDFDPIYAPGSGETVKAGSTYKITWAAPEKYKDGSISIHLIGGPTQNTQVPLLDIASGVANSANAYDWAVDASLGAATVYGLVFKLESDPSVFQYSNPFKIDGSAAGQSTSAAATGSATTTVPVTTGVKTVTLSSSSSTTPVVVPTTSCNTTVPVTTTARTIVSSIGYNCTTTTLTKATVPVVVSSTGAIKPTGTAVTTPPPAQVTSAGSRLGAGIVAAVAGVAIAVFAL